jgi:hypothetical protein
MKAIMAFGLDSKAGWMVDSMTWAKYVSAKEMLPRSFR